MSPRTSGDDCRNIVVADEDKVIAGLVIETLLNDGHAVFHAYDGLSATQLALTAGELRAAVRPLLFNGAS